MVRYVKKVHGVDGRYKFNTNIQKVEVIHPELLTQEDRIRLTWDAPKGYPNSLEFTLAEYADFKAGLPEAKATPDLAGIPIMVFYRSLEKDSISRKNVSLEPPEFDGIVARL